MAEKLLVPTSLTSSTSHRTLGTAQHLSDEVTSLKQQITAKDIEIAEVH
jgi:hypothetical protein